jgi:hypothetical protein
MGWVLSTANASSNAKTTSVSAGQSACGAPHRNRTGDPILTIDARAFTTPCSTSRYHTTAQVKDPTDERGVGRRKVACSAVSGKCLARTLHRRPWAWAPAPSSRSPRPQATGTSGAVLSSDDYGSSVERAATLHPLWRGACVPIRRQAQYICGGLGVVSGCMGVVACGWMWRLLGGGSVRS